MEVTAASQRKVFFEDLVRYMRYLHSWFAFSRVHEYFLGSPEFGWVIQSNAFSHDLHSVKWFYGVY